MHPGDTVPLIADALDHSVIYEEHRGDFAQARRIAEMALNQARRRGEPTTLADAWLGLGIIHVVQGRTRAATECVQQAQQLVPQDTVRRLRAATYAHLGTYWHFNRFPDGNGAPRVAGPLQCRPATGPGLRGRSASSCRPARSSMGCDTPRPRG
jgi:tetratricopeptide (TPR) repeat protein